MRLEIRLVRNTERKVHPSVYLVADHLDTALASGEDLLRLKLALTEPASEAGPDEHLKLTAELRRFVEQVRTLEMVISARVLQARHRAVELRRSDARMKPVVDLFIASTNALFDAIAELGDSTRADFQSGEQALVYLRTRGIVQPETASLAHTTELAISEEFLVAERIMLGPLLDLAGTFLDTLDLHYELYAGSEDSADEAA